MNAQDFVSETGEPIDAATLALIAKTLGVRSLAEAGADTPVVRVAIQNRKRVLSAIHYAFLQGRKAVSKLPAKPTSSEAIAAVSGVEDALRQALQDVLPETLESIFVAGAHAGLGMLGVKVLAQKPLFSRTSIFPPSNPEAQKWAREHGAELAKNLTETSMEAIRQTIEDAYSEEGLTGPEVYERILDAVGDEDRAKVIAHHESMTAASEGQRESWRAAVDKGLLDPDVEKEWIATAGACDICAELDGQKAPLNGDYPEPGGSGPPQHVNCMCTEGISG